MAITYDWLLKRQGSVFLDAASLLSDSTFRKALTNALADKRLYPLPTGAIAVRGAQAPAALIAAYFDPERSLQLLVSTQRFDLGASAAGLVPGTDLLAEDVFVDLCSELLGLCIEASGRHAHRMALVEESMATNINSARSPGSVVQKLLHLPNGTGDGDVPEWTWRIRREISAGTERYNVINRVSLESGVVNEKEFDALHFEFDVNTSHEDVRPRFAPADLAGQFAELRTLLRGAKETVEGMIGDF